MPLLQPIISVVMLTFNEGERLRQTVLGLKKTLPARSEIVVVDDGSTDDSTRFLDSARAPARVVRTRRLGTAMARNAGVRHSQGEVVLFADAHITVPGNWWSEMLAALDRPKAGAVAPSVSDLTERECRGYGIRLQGPDLMIEWLPPRRSTPYRVALLPGCCLGIRRETFESIGGFDEGLIRWGGMEHELGVRLWLQGYEMWLVPAIDCVHYFRESRPFRPKWSGVIHNRLRLAHLHFAPARIRRVLNVLKGHEGFAEAARMLAGSNVRERRAQLEKTRVHDSEWYFDRFGPDW